MQGIMEQAGFGGGTSWPHPGQLASNPASPPKSRATPAQPHRHFTAASVRTSNGPWFLRTTLPWGASCDQGKFRYFLMRPRRRSHTRTGHRCRALRWRPSPAPRGRQNPCACQRAPRTPGSALLGRPSMAQVRRPEPETSDQGSRGPASTTSTNLAGGAAAEAGALLDSSPQPTEPRSEALLLPQPPLMAELLVPQPAAFKPPDLLLPERRPRRGSRARLAMPPSHGRASAPRLRPFG